MFDLLRNIKQRMSAAKNLKIYDEMLDVADVKTGYDYWRKVLLNKIIRLFKYDGLPDTIPAIELEKILLLTGQAGITSTEEFGFVAVPTAAYGVGLYPSFFPRAIWATPLVKGDGVINKDIVLIRNDNALHSVSEIINRYARLMADVESTMALTLVNVRQPAIAASPDEATAYSYQAVQLAMRLGHPEAIINRSVLDDIKTIDAIHTVPPTLLTDIVEARESLLSQFFAEFGVASRQTKRAPMTISEVESDVQVMTVNITDMLESRQESLENLKTVYGLNVTVSIHPAYKPIEEPKPEEFNKTGDKLTGQAVEGGTEE